MTGKRVDVGRSTAVPHRPPFCRITWPSRNAVFALFPRLARHGGRGAGPGWHRRLLEARYRRADMHVPVLVSTEADVDSLIDALLAGPPSHDVAHLVSRARPMTWSGFPDHELSVGVNRGGQVGALMISAPETGFVASVGVLGSRNGVVHHVAEHSTEFPASLVRRTVQEVQPVNDSFADLSQGNPAALIRRSERRRARSAHSARRSSERKPRASACGRRGQG